MSTVSVYIELSYTCRKGDPRYRSVFLNIVSTVFINLFGILDLGVLRIDIGSLPCFGALTIL